jgi:lipopolysaccharide biosynthesis glycosyltransferase
MSFNNEYIFPVLVSAESILINSNNPYSFITFHFLCSPDITQNNISILKSLLNKSINAELIFYNMSNCFIDSKKLRYSQATYYRLLIPIFIKANKIIYLDADTLCLKDITEMYQLDINDYYVLGFYDYSKGYHKEKRTKKYINAGVMLLNLDKIRKDNKVYDLVNFFNNGTLLPKHDQTIINYAFYPKIGILPIKYGIWNFQNFDEIKVFINRLKDKVNITEFEVALKEPSILHILRCHPKIWYKNYKYRGKTNLEFQRFHNLWYKYAKQTHYYNKIKKFFKYRY